MKIHKSIADFFADFFNEMRLGVEDAPIEAAIYVGILLTIATVLVWQEFFI